MTFRRCRFWFIGLLLLVGCADGDKDPGIPVYDDPNPTYRPPVSSQVEAKSDTLAAIPKITRVTWSPVGSCNSRRVSTMQVTVTVDDPDTDVDELRFDGSVSGCSLQGRDFGPLLQGPSSRILCHHVSSHNGLITVVDPDGNGDSAFFRFGPCETGSYRP